MSTRALVGVEGIGGHFRVRSVHLDGYPTAMVPCLAAIVHTVHGGDLDAATTALLADNWSSLRHPDDLEAQGSGARIGRPSSHQGEPWTGRVTANVASDQEWAYLFIGAQLRLYLMVTRPRYRKAFVPWACWAVSALPDVGDKDLNRMQRSGQHAQRSAAWGLSADYIGRYRDETGNW